MPYSYAGASGGAGMAAGYYGVNELTATMQGVHVGGVAHPGAASPCGEVPGQPGVVIYPHMGAGMGMPPLPPSQPGGSPQQPPPPFEGGGAGGAAQDFTAPPRGLNVTPPPPGPDEPGPAAPPQPSSGPSASPPRALSPPATHN